MKWIDLGREYRTAVDDEDYEELSKHSWHARVKKNNRTYAKRNVWINGKSVTYLMHRVIKGVTDSLIKIDHEDRDGLNNRRYNLRLCSNQENTCNQIKRAGSSKYKGVSWHKTHGKWQASINSKSIHFYLGVFDKEDDAALAYNQAALLHHGDFALLNVIGAS